MPAQTVLQNILSATATNTAGYAAASQVVGEGVKAAAGAAGKGIAVK